VSAQSPNSSIMSPSVIPNNSQEIKCTSKDIGKNLSNPYLQTSGIALNNTGKKILNYKILIKWLDIIASFLIILGCFISQVENEENYYYNLQNRVQSVKLISDVYHNETKKIDEYKFITLMEEKFAKQINYSDYSTIPVILEVNQKCNNLRLIILLTTFVSVPLIIYSRYIEFKRENLYKLNSESKEIYHKIF